MKYNILVSFLAESDMSDAIRGILVSNNLESALNSQFNLVDYSGRHISFITLVSELTPEVLFADIIEDIRYLCLGDYNSKASTSKGRYLMDVSIVDLVHPKDIITSDVILALRNYADYSDKELVNDDTCIAFVHLFNLSPWDLRRLLNLLCVTWVGIKSWIDSIYVINSQGSAEKGLYEAIKNSVLGKSYHICYGDSKKSSYKSLIDRASYVLVDVSVDNTVAGAKLGYALATNKRVILAHNARNACKKFYKDSCDVILDYEVLGDLVVKLRNHILIK